MIPGLLAAALLALGAARPALAAGAGYQAQAGRLYDAAGQEIQLRGISHFGFNADILQPQYLWSMGWKEQIAQIKSLGFNAVRVPFVPDTLYVTTPVDQLSWVDPNKNADLLGKTPLQVLDLWMAEADRQGLYILLDFHSVAKARQYPTWFVDTPGDFGITWNAQAYTEDHWVRDLKFVAQRYAGLSRFIGIDLYNEPNGKVRWSAGDPNMTESKYYWKPAVEKAAAGILQSNPNLLIFVQGITANWDGVENSGVPMNWGENFQPQAYQPLNVAAGKLVLSPHTYGPDVYVKSSFGAANFPANLAADWDTLFGRFSSEVPVVVGEWGGRYGQGGVGQADVTWQNAFVDYLLAKNVRSSFYWCYTPNSGDTGGILTDALEVRQDKMDLLKRHWGAAPATSTPEPAPTPQPASATPGSLALSAASYSVQQSAGSVTIRVNRAGGSAGAVSVRFETASGTARARTDYTVRRGLLSWAAGDVADKTVVIPISTVKPFSGSKSFAVNLSSASGGAVLGSPASASVTITGSKTTTTYAQPAIGGFTPSSGAVGTVVTVTGSGFTGANAAWVGDGHDAALSVVSDTQASVTVPADATSGAIAVFNPLYSAFSSGSFTLTSAAPAPPPSSTPQTYTQPYIMSFAPTSGPVGTVVTLTGSGFTGLNAAWVGSAHDGVVTAVSDTQVKVTVPAAATTGAIGLLNPSYASFTSSSFTVTASTTTTPPPSTTTTTYPQPAISSFSPTSGAVGTVVTVAGTGFTGVNAAWVGSGHDAAVTVVSDTQARVTVPASATNGAIALLNPAKSTSSTGSFTVTVGATTTPPPAGTLSLRVQGNRLIDSAGNVVQMRGVNYSGFEFAPIQGWSGNDPSGGQAGQPGGPKWSALQSWKVNTLRIPLNEASWLGRTCTDSSGVARNADPAGNYQSAVQTQVAQANAAGIYVIVDLHWSAPGNTCPMLQTQMANADNSLAFWTSVANTFKNNPAVVFELFNEPFMNFGFTGDTWSYMMQGTNGSFSSFPATSPTGGWKEVKQAWAIASYQAMLDTVRATGATNVVMVGTMQYAQDLSGWLAHVPNDPLKQMAAAWHPYQKYQSAWDYPYPNFYPEVMTDAQNILAAGIPLVMTEVGGRNTPGTPSSPIITTMTDFADANGIGVLGWTWDVWGDPDHVLIKDVNGTPTDGYGVVYRNWMLAH